MAKFSNFWPSNRTTYEFEMKGSQWLQFLATICASFSLVACGMYTGWSSPSLPHLTDPDSKIPLTREQGSWVTSIYVFGSICGSFISSFFIDSLGRKRSMVAFAFPQVVGWILIITGKTYIILFVARFIAGIAHGALHSIAMVYYAEIADKNIRGTCASFLKLSTNTGNLLAYSTGAYVSYETLNNISLAVPLLFLATFVFMPETPYFYLIKNREERAVKSLLTLRRLRNPEDVKADIAAMKKSVEDGRRSGNNLIKELISTKANRLGLLILLSLKVTDQLSGQMAVTGYTQEIFSFTGSSIPPEEATIIVGAAQLVTGLGSAYLVDRIGRRILILSSGMIAAISLTAVGLFFFFKLQLERDVSAFTWIPILGVVLYQIMMAAGVGSLPYIILGEIYAPNVKGKVVGISIIIGSLFASLVSLEFSSMNESYGIYTTFWIFAVICSVGTLVSFFIIPETKGQTLEEILVMMNSRKKVKNDCEPPDVVDVSNKIPSQE